MRFIITDTFVNNLVMISVHDTTFRGGEPGDVYFDLTLRTWREPVVHTKAGSTTAAATAKSGVTASAAVSRPDTKKIPKTYTVKAGDSLSQIAKLELGSSAKWEAIYALNKSTIGPDANKIKPGQKLVMPS
jgi:LysM repeat protein